MSMSCSVCGKRAYSNFCTRHKPRKRIRQKGKAAIKYEQWRDEVARKYLDEKFGRICAACNGEKCGNLNLDIDHIKNRGSNARLKMSLTNVQYLGRFPCHQLKTDGKI